eukprot:10546883-Ditylum_brightwellii.AAC.1
MQKPLKKNIACAVKEYGNLDRKRKRQDKPKSHHKRCHGLGKHHQSKHKKKFCDYHGICYHNMDKCNFVQTCRKHVQPMHHITDQQRLQQARFVKEAKR